MKVRRFRFYAKREDLQAILEEFQSKFDVYYVPTYSDEGPVFFKDAASLPDLGTNFFGSHQGADPRIFRNNRLHLERIQMERP